MNILDHLLQPVLFPISPPNADTDPAYNKQIPLEAESVPTMWAGKKARLFLCLLVCLFCRTCAQEGRPRERVGRN